MLVFDGDTSPFDPKRIHGTTPEYPSGSFKDETTPGKTDDGTPVIQAWLNDWLGFDYSLVKTAGLSAGNLNGKPDTALLSDRMIAFQRIFSTVAGEIKTIDVSATTTDISIPPPDDKTGKVPRFIQIKLGAGITAPVAVNINNITNLVTGQQIIIFTLEPPTALKLSIKGGAGGNVKTPADQPYPIDQATPSGFMCIDDTSTTEAILIVGGGGGANENTVLNTELREGIVTNFATDDPKSVPSAVTGLVQLKPKLQKIPFNIIGNQPITKDFETTLVELDCTGLTADAALDAIHGAILGQNFSLYLINVPTGITVSVKYSPTASIRSSFVADAKGTSILPASTCINFTGVERSVVSMDSQPQLQSQVGAFIPGFATPKLLTFQVSDSPDVRTIQGANFPSGWTARRLATNIGGFFTVLIRPEPQPANDANFVLLAMQNYRNPIATSDILSVLVTGFGYRAAKPGAYPAGWYFSLFFSGSGAIAIKTTLAATLLITPMPFPTNPIPNIVG